MHNSYNAYSKNNAGSTVLCNNYPYSMYVHFKYKILTTFNSLYLSFHAVSFEERRNKKLGKPINRKKRYNYFKKMQCNFKFKIKYDFTTL